MKTSTSLMSVAAGISLMTVLPVSAQKAPSASPPSKTYIAEDAKEKAEDAALLQQLDIEQQVKAESKQNGAWTPIAKGRGERAGGAPFRVQNILTRPAAARAMVIRTTETDGKTTAALEEDLAVMSHILTKSLEEIPGAPGNGNKVMGIDVFFNGSSPLRSLYLDHYGAVFFLGVNFPLIAPPEKHQEEKTVGDSTWEEARQEVYGQGGPGGIGEPAEDYSQEKVDRLKDTLCAALKNASNIRGLRPEEFVTIWVSGGNSGSGRQRGRVQKNNTGALAGNVIGLEPAGQARHTVLTIQASKADIDAYAKGKQTDEAFQKHARLTTYTGDGAAGPGEAMTFYTGRNRF